ncbi:MAG TPA: DUF4010 domain-containing protein, partial [Nevskiaceae bacterium]|nr:DUF4010 domain-containing protein [Nevskiaceae bacterium]
GVRSFALIALAGTACALLAERASSSALLAAGALVVGAVLLSAARVNLQNTADAGTTTTMAGLLCYALGAMVWHGEAQLAAALALVATMLLYFRSELHSVTRRLTRQDLLSLLQFSVITLIVLPVLPDHGYGPYAAFNPYQIWLMVVIVVAVSLSGYATLRLLGERKGVAVIGLLGGLVTSTATTLVFSRHVRRGSATLAVAQLVILTANLVVLVRLAMLTLLIAPAVLPRLLPVFLPALLLGALVPLRAWLKLDRREQSPALDVSNPTELPMALGVGAVFALVLLATSWLDDRVGSAGVYGMAALMGLTDLDAITLSTLRLVNLGQLQPAQAVTAIVIAFCSNLGFKLAAVLALAGRALWRQVASGYAMVAIGLVGAWLLVIR